MMRLSPQRPVTMTLGKGVADALACMLVLLTLLASPMSADSPSAFSSASRSRHCWASRYCFSPRNGRARRSRHCSGSLSAYWP